MGLEQEQEQEQDYEGDFSKFGRVLEEAFGDIDYVFWFQV